MLQQVSVPNYYWKAILKIRTTNGYITDACAVGIWLEHKAYKDSDYTQYIVSIDDIESKTGFRLSMLRLTSPMLSASKSLMAVLQNTPPGRRTRLIEDAHLSRKLRIWSINCTK